MKLSKNLTLEEVTNSLNAKRLGINNQPTPDHLENLKILAEKIFQPIREHFSKPINVSSGYRSKELNEATPGASKTSQHSKGEALDLDQDSMNNKITNKMVFDFIKDNLEFDQLIWEFGTDQNPDWVHVSYKAKGSQRKQILKAVRTNGKVKYKSWA